MDCFYLDWGSCHGLRFKRIDSLILIEKNDELSNTFERRNELKQKIKEIVESQSNKIDATNDTHGLRNVFKLQKVYKV